MEQYGVTTRSGKTRTSPRGNDDSDEDTRTKTDSWQHHIYRNEHVECRDRRDILERRQHRKRIPRNESPATSQTTIKATRRLQELELREIRAAKALAKTDRALGQLYDDEECLDTCHETVEIPTDRSPRSNLRPPTKLGDKGTRTNEHVRAPSRETENLTRH
ncbi:hypothetical protein EVAR_98943_1 [Eumeta japonica]|uniref:Uncharacterized protein n=1 Tax=Eumeta variegata TaxID=151549 RepID=A0A4C1SRI7_EUMVA|nr:hypothetical protein EVAR_98943_1 [Eumeta japonica]